jgi:hypothetical protein
MIVAMGVVRRAVGAIALAGCYSSAGEAPCSVACDFMGSRACPGELTCQRDNLCHASSNDCLDSYALAVMADHPIAYWRLDDPPGSTTAVDLIRLVDGKYIGNCTLGVSGALSTNSAVRFDGMTCWIQLADTPALRFAATSPYTIEAWAYPDPITTPQYRHVFTRETRPAGAPTNGYALLLTDQQVGQAERAVNPQNITVESAILPGFQHLAAVYDGNTLILYIDAVEVGLASTNLSMSIFQGLEFIGAAGPNDNPFPGVLDEIAIYDRALTQPQLMAHFAARD